ncbi:MAG: hypothetical protein U9R44_03795 [Candidatus Omnitrophota bacterium]|nr:hypothetical protein [Candidatus Omnitrophota bacterium]
MKRGKLKTYAAFCAGLLTAGMLLALAACIPTYPKEKLPEAVKIVCKDEYGMNVDVMVVGETMGIYYPMEGLLDVGLGIKKDAWDEISNLILVASRVVLSTDADIKFYCVITQDARLPELQIVIIKYVDDVKRGMYRNISRNESFKRTLFSLNLTPQAKKERSIEKVFAKLGVEEETRKKVLDEFFRSPPTRLSDIGYWRGRFYLKDISIEEFLAAQMSNRIKLDFRGDKRLEQLFAYKTSEGTYISRDGKGGHFLIKFKITDQRPVDEITNPRVKKIQEILRIINEVVYGYKFYNFDFVAMEDQLENTQLRVSARDILDFIKKGLSVEEIVRAPSGYFLQAGAQ